jgi:hypothetical protein
MFISGVNDTGDKLFGCVNNTANKFVTGSTTHLCHEPSVIGSVIDTGDKFITGVFDTNRRTIIAGDNNTGNKFITHWYQRHCSTILANDNNTCDKFFAGINDTDK